MCSALIVTLGIPCTGAAADPIGMNAVYFYPGWGNLQDPVAAMSATGIKQFTLAFVLSDGSCTPKWDGWASLTSNPWRSAISRIRGAGGDVVVAMGGASGNKLGEKCSSASALANAYQKVIDAYQLKAIDIDIEGSELYASSTVRQRVISALKIIQNNNPSVKIYITFGAYPDAPQIDLMKRGAAAGLNVSGWTGMPFDYGPGGHTGSMAAATMSTIDLLKSAVANIYRYDSDTAYRHVGISSMNGKTDQADETVTTSDFKSILAYAQRHHLARFTFWSLNRDRPCGGMNTEANTCSGIPQSPYSFTRIIAGYHG